jgi:hypothetical protein
LKSLSITTNPDVKTVFEKYPVEVRLKIENLRRIIFETANEIEEITQLEETLKWGEPSYLAKKGSTIRIDWKPKTPEQYAMYFSCSTTLVETFKKVYENTFEFEGKRAIVFQLDEEIPEKEFKNCIRAALTYHRIKNIDKLGL